MESIYLVEATTEYAKQVWQFRQEVFDYDKNSDSQFAGCLSLDEVTTADEWKKLKTVFYTISGLLLLLCGGVMFFAFNPDMTGKLADALYGEDRNQYKPPAIAAPTYEPTAGLEELLTQGPKETPVGLPTPTPPPPIDMSDNGAGIFVIARNNGDMYVKYSRNDGFSA